MAAFFLIGLGIEQEESKDEGLKQTIYKVLKVRLHLFLENLADCLATQGRFLLTSAMMPMLAV